MVALCPKDVGLVSYKSIVIVYIIKYIIGGKYFPYCCEHYVHKNFSFFCFSVHLLFIVVDFMIFLVVRLEYCFFDVFQPLEVYLFVFVVVGIH